MNDTMNDAKDTTEIAEEMDTPTVLTLPLLAMRGIVLFPGMIMHFDLAREPFVKALKAGMESDRRVVLVTQKDPLIEEPKPDDLYTVGVIAEVRQILRAPDGVTRVLVEGKERVTITSAVLESDKKDKSFYPHAEFKYAPETPLDISDPHETAAVSRCIKDIFQEYADLLPRMPKELAATVFCEQDDTKMFNEIVFNLAFDYVEKQRLLEENDWLERLKMLYQTLVDEMDILRMERKIQEKTQENLDRSQREYYLREQMHQIAEQLGESEDPAAEMETYTDAIAALPLDDASRKKLEKEASVTTAGCISGGFCDSQLSGHCPGSSLEQIQSHKAESETGTGGSGTGSLWTAKGQRTNSGKHCSSYTAPGSNRTNPMFCRTSRCRKNFYRTFYCKGTGSSL